MSNPIHPTAPAYDASPTHASTPYANANSNNYTSKRDTTLDHGRNMDSTTGTVARPTMFNRIRASALFQRLMRTLQFLSSFISLILFSIRIRKVKQLVGRLSHASGAVEGILAAAVLYTLALILLNLLKRRPGSRLGGDMLTWLLVAMDIAFVGAFIAVAVLTSSRHGGDSGGCGGRRFDDNGRAYSFAQQRIRHSTGCGLPWGTFALAILSTLLHAATAIFHKTKEHQRQKEFELAARDGHAHPVGSPVRA